MVLQPRCFSVGRLTVTKHFEEVKCFTCFKKDILLCFLFLFHLFNSIVTNFKYEVMKNQNN